MSTPKDASNWSGRCGRNPSDVLRTASHPNHPGTEFQTRSHRGLEFGRARQGNNHRAYQLVVLLPFFVLPIVIVAILRGEATEIGHEVAIPRHLQDGEEYEIPHAPTH